MRFQPVQFNKNFPALIIKIQKDITIDNFKT